MVNNVTLMGRLTRDVEVKYTSAGVAVGKFSIAIERDYKKQGEEKQTDFVPCVAYGKTAEFISSYFAKGNMIAVIGGIRTGSYTNKEGGKVYTTEVFVDKASFTGEKNQKLEAGEDCEIGDDLGDELPF